MEPWETPCSNAPVQWVCVLSELLPRATGWEYSSSRPLDQVGPKGQRRGRKQRQWGSQRHGLACRWPRSDSEALLLKHLRANSGGSSMPSWTPRAGRMQRSLCYYRNRQEPHQSPPKRWSVGRPSHGTTWPYLLTIMPIGEQLMANVKWRVEMRISVPISFLYLKKFIFWSQ